ncbi:MAG: hypothetical protein OES84_05220, partial [Kiritimatiellaceae bacterium]|nr:hypothetical protein [Kiritimatiellaceae bacterium]
TRKILMMLLAVTLTAAPAYAKNNKHKNKGKSLPHGLHKKSEKGKPLPPGWQNKISKGDVLEVSIFSRGKIVSPAGKDGIMSISVEGKIIKLHGKTRKVIKISK